MPCGGSPGRAPFQSYLSGIERRDSLIFIAETLCSNRTLVELKGMNPDLLGVQAGRSNRTLVELKAASGTTAAQAENVPIVP